MGALTPELVNNVEQMLNLLKTRAHTMLKHQYMYLISDLLNILTKYPNSTSVTMINFTLNCELLIY